MAGERLTAQPAIAGADVANTDVFGVVDVSDTASSPNSGPGGTVKQLTAAELPNVPAVAAALAAAGAELYVAQDGTITNIVRLTQVAYDALAGSRSATTLYVIVG